MRRGLLIAAVAVAASLVLSPCDESAPTAGQGGSWLPSTVGQALAQPVQHGDRLVTQVASATQPVDPSQWIDAPADARFTTLGWFAPTSRSVAKPPLPAEVTRAYVIPVREAITDKLALVLRRKAAEALKNNAQMVIFDLETPGGSIAAMLEINRLISNDLKDVYTVAWVNDRAYSAGALISLACTEIVMTRSGIIGDAMPIMAGPAGIQEIPEKERGKMESALRGEVRVLAGQAGYDVDLCEAMITIDMELWLIRNRGDRRGGELMIVNADEYRERVAGVPISISQTQPANPAAAEWEFVRQIVGPTKLVTLTNDEATLYGLNSRTVNSMAELRDAYNITAEPVVIEDVWSEQLVGFLTSPFVATMLLIVGGLLFYVEMHTPGFGVAGSLAIACLALLLGSHYLIGLANWWEIALIVLGVILLVLEIFFIPGFGVAGVSGIILILIGLLGVIIPNAPTAPPWPSNPLEWNFFERGLIMLTIAIVGCMIGAVILSRYLPRTAFGRVIMLAPAEHFDEPPTTDQAPLRGVAAGQVGTAQTVCRPVGRAMFGDELVDVVSEGGMIASGQKVRVLRIEGNMIVVEQA